MRITVEITIKAPLEAVWEAWTKPSIIQQWNGASQAWYCPHAVIDLHEGGRFDYQLEHQAGEHSFRASGTFTQLKLLRLIHYKLDDGRQVEIDFEERDQHIHIRQTFDIAPHTSIEAQRAKWQDILNYFKKVVETNALLS